LNVAIHLYSILRLASIESVRDLKRRRREEYALQFVDILYEFLLNLYNENDYMLFWSF